MSDIDGKYLVMILSAIKSYKLFSGKIQKNKTGLMKQLSLNDRWEFITIAQGILSQNLGHIKRDR